MVCLVSTFQTVPGYANRRVAPSGRRTCLRLSSRPQAMAYGSIAFSASSIGMSAPRGNRRCSLIYVNYHKACSLRLQLPTRRTARRKAIFCRSERGSWLVWPVARAFTCARFIHGDQRLSGHDRRVQHTEQSDGLAHFPRIPWTARRLEIGDGFFLEYRNVRDT